MRFTRTMLLAGGAALLATGTAAAAADRLNKMQVALPDGGTVQVEYAGEVAPKIVVVPVEQRRIAHDPFAELDRIAFEMRARHQAMLRQMVAMQQAAAQARAAGSGVTLASDLPAGAHVTYFSSTTDANGCTQTVRYSSDGSGAEPEVTRASSGSCDAASASDAAPTPATAPEPAPRELDDFDV